MNILLLGANGFIGSNLTQYVLREQPGWHITGLDLRSDKLAPCLGHERFHFTQGDMTREKAWVEAQIARADVVLPLVAIANPAVYVKNPLAVFELDFEANLEIVRLCVKHKKRIIFPSTSEVYGMSADAPYDEETSNLTVGPVQKERWIYSCSKQMLDRVIYAYGKRDGLDFTLFRPFNWFGPGLDDVWDDKASSRVVSQFLSNILHGRDIVLVGGGAQKRCFLYIDDAIGALARIIANEEDRAQGRIFNIGHPGNECSIAELAEMMLDVLSAFPGYEDIRARVHITTASGDAYYGSGYQDIASRVPKIENAKQWLGWEPETGLREALRKTIAYYLNQARVK